MQNINWQEIESKIHELEKVEGGFSGAIRGLIKLDSGQVVFIKIGHNDDTKKWANKEIQVYRYLNKIGFAYVPKLLGVNEDETGFCLEALTSDKGWDWSATWDKNRIAATLKAMDEIAELDQTDELKQIIGQDRIDDSVGGWQPLAESEDIQLDLKERAAKTKLELPDLDFQQELELSQSFEWKFDKLVHDDMRADNVPYNASTGQIMIVDWNWLGFGDRRIDLAAAAVHIQKSGFDLTKDYPQMLDRGAMQWLAGFWLYRGAIPIWPGGPDYLRDHQLESGLVAYKLANR